MTIIARKKEIEEIHGALKMNGYPGYVTNPINAIIDKTISDKKKKEEKKIKMQ